MVGRIRQISTVPIVGVVNDATTFLRLNRQPSAVCFGCTRAGAGMWLLAQWGFGTHVLSNGRKDLDALGNSTTPTAASASARVRTGFTLLATPAYSPLGSTA